MLDRREYLRGSMSAGLLALCGDCFAVPVREPIRTTLQKTVGTRDKVAGMVAVVVDESGANTVAYGSSGVFGVKLDERTVFEIGSVTKVMTALLLTDMAARGEVAMDDPVAKYLPSSVTVHERGRPITLLDLAHYDSGLPKLPGNLPANWWTSQNPFGDYTVENLYDFISRCVPEFAPGTHFEYSSLGFGLLGLALARRAGTTYEELLIDKICAPLGLSETRISLSGEMKRHMVQPHDVDSKPVPLWDLLPSLQGAGAARASVHDIAVFLKACMGLVPAAHGQEFSRLLATRRPTNLAGTDAGLGWFITAQGNEEIAWKSGLTGGCNTFVGFSTRRRRGAIVLSNFVWQPLDVGTTAMGMKLISADFDAGDLKSLYA